MSQNVAALLRGYGLRPRKGLGQNFLSDPAALARIVEAADLSAADTVVEVGAGVGTLTRLLAEQAGRVVAVELDPRLVDILRDQLADLDNVRLVQGERWSPTCRTILLRPCCAGFFPSRPARAAWS